MRSDDRVTWLHHRGGGDDDDGESGVVDLLVTSGVTAGTFPEERTVFHVRVKNGDSQDWKLVIRIR